MAPNRSALDGYISETGAGWSIRKTAGNRAESHVSKDIRTKSLVWELRIQEGYKVWDLPWKSNPSPNFDRL